MDRRNFISGLASLLPASFIASTSGVVGATRAPPVVIHSLEGFWTYLVQRELDWDIVKSLIKIHYEHEGVHKEVPEGVDYILDFSRRLVTHSAIE
jgi:hypothetical protein